MSEAVELASKAEQLYVFNGKKVVHVNLRQEQPDTERLKKLMLGPTGNLRAPTIKKGKALLVGFNEQEYDKVLT